MDSTRHLKDTGMIDRYWMWFGINDFHQKLERFHCGWLELMGFWEDWIQHLKILLWLLGPDWVLGAVDSTLYNPMARPCQRLPGAPCCQLQMRCSARGEHLASAGHLLHRWQQPSKLGPTKCWLWSLYSQMSPPFGWIADHLWQSTSTPKRANVDQVFEHHME